MVVFICPNIVPLVAIRLPLSWLFDLFCEIEDEPIALGDLERSFFSGLAKKLLFKFELRYVLLLCSVGNSLVVTQKLLLR